MNTFLVQVTAQVKGRKSAHSKRHASEATFAFHVEGDSAQDALQSTANIFCKEDGYTVALAEVQA
jgi:hypothetical protein